MKKRASALVMAGLISVQTLAPTVTSFANEIKLNTEEVNSNARTVYLEIPDPKLRAELNKYVAKMNGTTVDPNARIDSDDLNKLSGVIDLRNKGIKNIDGIQYLINAEEIWLSSNEIEDVTPLKRVYSYKLKGLYLGDNKIKNIDAVRQMYVPNLTDLSIYANQIEDISPLAKVLLPNLKNLYIDTNRIKDISPLAGMRLTSLTNLVMHDNQIEDISSLATANMPNLRNLNLNRNKISDISAIGEMKSQNLRSVYVQNQNIRGEKVTTHSDSAVVDNIVTGIDGKKVEPKTDGVYTSYDNNTGKITFEKITSSGDREYDFSQYINLGDMSGSFSGKVTHNIEVLPPEVEKPEEKPPVVPPEVEKPEEKPPVEKPEENTIKAGLNKENGGIMLSSDGAGLRFFTKIENVPSEEVAAYYVTTASNPNEEPKFEVRATIVNKDYSQLKTTIDFKDLNKLNDNENTKLYVKRVVNGKATYTEIETGNVDLSKAFEIENKDIVVSVTKDENGAIQLNKKPSTSVFEQGVSKVEWNLNGMVVEGSPTNNGTNSAFNNSKVSMVFKDANGEYVKEKGTSNILEVRGSYTDGKYKITIPYENLTDVKTFELRLIGSNIVISDVLKQGSVTNFRTGLKDGKVFKLSTCDDKVINLTVEDLGEVKSTLTSSRVTTDKTTDIKQFSINGDIVINGIDIAPTDVKCSIVAKKGGVTLFEQALTKTGNNGVKTNLSATKFVNAKLSQNDEVSFTIKVQYLGQVIESDLRSNKVSVQMTDDTSNQTFEMKSKDGKVIVVRK